MVLVAVLLGLAKVPDGICVDLLRSGVLAPDETLKILPLTRYLRIFHSLFTTGFIITNKKVIIYFTQHFTGLKKKQDFLLADIADHSVTYGAEEQTFRFRLKDGRDIGLALKLSQAEGSEIDQQLRKLLAEEEKS